MQLYELYARIELPGILVERLNQCGKSVPTEAITAFEKQLKEHVPYELAAGQLADRLMPDEDGCRMLYALLSVAVQAYDAYLEKNLPESVFTDTMKGFTRIARENHAATGRWFFDRGWWVGRHLSLKLFRIGTLEYEILSETDGKEISIHIPSDANLADTDASLAESYRFFERFYPEYGDAPYVCTSWLMSPALDRLLDESSRIATFKSKFQLLRYFPDDESYKWFVFKDGGAAPKDFPENTRLQRNIKRYVLSGGKIGAAKSILIQKRMR